MSDIRGSESILRDRHLYAISQTVRDWGPLSIGAIGLAQVRLEASARLSRAHDEVVSLGRGQRRTGDRHAKERKRAAAFAFKGEGQLERLIHPPLDELSALLELPSALQIEEARRLQEQSDGSAPEESPISDEDKKKVLDEVMRRCFPGDFTPGENEARRAEQQGALDATREENRQAYRNSLEVDDG